MLDLCLGCSYDVFFFFFFKQKTAYEVRISDWSSDVCSSDLLANPAHGLAVRRHHREGAEIVQDVLGGNRLAADAAVGEGDVFRNALKIGRASCRERVCQYV